jgi:predicted Zn-dependent protease
MPFDVPTRAHRQPNLAMLHINKAVTLVTLGRWEEAEQTARRILQLDSESIDGHYVLGVAMLRQQKITPETEAHLAIATKKYARARPYLAEAVCSSVTPKTRI